MQTITNSKKKLTKFDGFNCGFESGPRAWRSFGQTNTSLDVWVDVDVDMTHVGDMWVSIIKYQLYFT